jgi:hypothetical protein
MKTKALDPTVDRVRKVRHQISAEFGHDPKRLLEHYAELERTYTGRFLGEEISDGILRTVTKS